MSKDIILHGDVYSCLNSLENNSISVAITSPPYWMQRDYGFEGQIGQEKKPEEYIGRLVTVYNKLRDKITDDGLFFLNIGDKYLNRYGKSHLLQIPYRLAYHMVNDGWILEDIIMWYKPNHMPSSVKDRFANTYEPVLVFSKNKDNIFKKNSNVTKIMLQPTPWKHTAAFPEKLIEDMLNRADLKNNDLVLDPFAGTGTVAVAVKKIRSSLYPINISTILIEKGDNYIDIIQERTGIKQIKKIDDINYEWKKVQETDLLNISAKSVNSDKYGEVSIFEKSENFKSAIMGLKTNEFNNFHRKDALYFFGVKNWTIEDLYLINRIFEWGFVLRNMIIVSDSDYWYPIFMFASKSTRVAYKFYLDRVRINPKNSDKREWIQDQFIGSIVRDVSCKKTKEGRIIEILTYYEDGFPKTVAVQWDNNGSIELVLHPGEDEFLMEGLVLSCPYCTENLEEEFDPMSDNYCPNCQKMIFSKKDNLPILKEPEEVLESINDIEDGDYIVGQMVKLENIEDKKKTSSKFDGLDRINWGASPGARKVMLGEYFTKMRLYRLDQPTVAQYLTLLRESKNLKTKNIVEAMPKGYTHTVGHWFRKDFGGSIPITEDVEKLKSLIGIEGTLLKVLERTALKFQTVKSSIKGRNPGDFIEYDDNDFIEKLLKLLYLNPNEYLKIIKEESEIGWPKPK